VSPSGRCGGGAHLGRHWLHPSGPFQAEHGALCYRAFVSGDAQLLEAWRGGDHDAGERLVGAHYDSVLLFFRTKAGDEADDLVQRTFLRCLEPRSTFRGQSSFRAFLFGVARNVLYEHIRSRVRDRKADPDFGVSSILDLNPRASTVVFARTEQRRLIQALQRLPIDIQMTLELHYWEDLSVEETAEALDIPPGTVKSRLHRGRGLLRELIANEAPDADPGSVDEQLNHWAAFMRSQRPESPA
jgi:RNA polymerase sigma factor (sigma-70 family)